MLLHNSRDKIKINSEKRNRTGVRVKRNWMFGKNRKGEIFCCKRQVERNASGFHQEEH